MDRTTAWRAVVHGVARVRHDSATKHKMSPDLIIHPPKAKQPLVRATVIDTV